jgi:hypothetical protein
LSRQNEHDLRLVGFPPSLGLGFGFAATIRPYRATRHAALEGTPTASRRPDVIAQEVTEARETAPPEFSAVTGSLAKSPPS